jgi:hypothetical protein
MAAPGPRWDLNPYCLTEVYTPFYRLRLSSSATRALVHLVAALSALANDESRPADKTERLQIITTIIVVCACIPTVIVG